MVIAKMEGQVEVNKKVKYLLELHSCVMAAKADSISST
jgi:hypothetical protein